MRLVQRPINPKVKDMVIRPEKPKRFSESPWECKKYEGMKRVEDAQGIKWAKDAPRNETGRACPRNKMGQGSPRWNIRQHGLKEGVAHEIGMAGPEGA